AGTDTRIGAGAHALVWRLEIETVQRALIPHAQALERLARRCIRSRRDSRGADDRRCNAVVLLALPVQLRVAPIGRRLLALTAERIDHVALGQSGGGRRLEP